MSWFCRHLCTIGGGRGEVNLSWIYMCIVLYMMLLWCNGFPEISVQLEEGMGSICHRYMCIVLYMKLSWCHGFADIYAQLEEEGWDQSAIGICALCYIWDWFGVMVFQRSLLNWRRAWGQSAIDICALCYIYETGDRTHSFFYIWIKNKRERDKIHYFYSEAGLVYEGISACLNWKLCTLFKNLM